MVTAELTRRVSIGDGASMNQFNSLRTFPDPTFTSVVRPNADTLYSQLWFNVSDEPIVISVPDSAARYYLLPALDMWTDVFASTGSRTTGTGAQTIVMAREDWKGAVPAGAMLIRTPTHTGWIIGRFESAGPSDYAIVNRLQDALTVTPISKIGTAYTAPKSVADPSWDVKTPPAKQIEQLTPAQYFGLFAELMKTNPPHQNDYPIVHQMERMGIVPGQSFSLASASADVRQALEAAPKAGLARIGAAAPRMGNVQNGWRTNLETMGAYGTAYLNRAAIAAVGLGANLVEDAVYPSAFADSEGKIMSSDNSYVMHFAKDQIPPVNGFWSLTMYDDRQLFTANPINRYAIGNRNPLKFNADGSLDLFIQRTSPGTETESNWLPSPASGPFTMNLRLYWPKESVLDGSWAPPPVERTVTRAEAK